VIEALIVEAKKSTTHLARALARAENDIVAGTLQTELDAVGKHLTALTEERDWLLTYIGQGELTPEEIEMVRHLVAEVRDELANPDFATKRYLVDKLNVRAVLKRQGEERWLEVTCGIALESGHLSFETSTSLETDPYNFPSPSLHLPVSPRPLSSRLGPRPPGQGQSASPQL
jgi:hypothetical protein